MSLRRKLLLIRRRRRLLAWRSLLLLLGILHRDAARNRAVRRESRTYGKWGLLRLLLGLRLRIVLRVVCRIVFVFVGCGSRKARRCFAGAPRTQDDVPRNPLALVADHDHVVSGSLQKLREYVVRRAGAKISENPLIFSISRQTLE